MAKGWIKEQFLRKVLLVETETDGDETTVSATVKDREGTPLSEVHSFLIKISDTTTLAAPDLLVDINIGTGGDVLEPGVILLDSDENGEFEILLTNGAAQDILVEVTSTDPLLGSKFIFLSLEAP